MRLARFKYELLLWVESIFYMNRGQKIAQRLEGALVALHRLPPRGPGGWGLLAAGAVFVSVAVDKSVAEARRVFK